MANHVIKKRKLSHSVCSDSQESFAASTYPSESGEVFKDSRLQTEARGHKTQTVSSKSPKYSRCLSNNKGQKKESAGTSQNVNSTFSQMQVNELLADVSVRHEKSSKIINPFLRKVERLINSIPSQGPTSANEARNFLHRTYGSAIPLPQGGPKADAKYTFSFKKPAVTCTAGNHTLQMGFKGTATRGVDMAVEMPSSIFQANDYKDFRYYHKRAYYLACIVSAIRKEDDLGIHVHYAYENDCLLQPILLLTPIEDAQIGAVGRFKWHIRILTAVDEKLFPANKTLPWIECPWLTSNVLMNAPDQSKFTSLYNSALQVESSRTSYEKLLENVSKHCSGYRDTCKLGNLWLRQRGFQAGIRASGFGSFEFSATTALLLSGGGLLGRPVLSPLHDSFQLFKGVVRYLATRNLIEEPSVICGDVEFPSYGSNKAPMLYDAARGLNVLYKMSYWSYKCLMTEAQTTLRTLGNSMTMGQDLEDVFLSKIDQPILRFDMSLRLKIPVSWSSGSAKSASEDRVTTFASKLHKVLLEGLGDRVVLINLQLPRLTAQRTGSILRTSEAESTIIIHLLLSAKQSNRIVDRGPSAEEKEAALTFRRFWGEKAELRRYQDGSILESLVWSQSASEGSISEQIIRHVVKRHLGEKTAQSLACVADNFHYARYDHDKLTHQPLQPYTPLLAAYKNLEKKIHGIEELPLQVHSVAASCERLRYTSLTSNGKVPSKALNVPMDIIIRFEGSSRWPNSLPAIQWTKVALLLKIAELLRRPSPNLVTRVGFENTPNQPIQNIPFLDVIPPDSPHLAFRLRIHHEPELALLERRLEASSVSLHEQTLIASAIAVYKQKFLHGPLHTQVVNSLCTIYPLLSPSIRLLKTWCATHLCSTNLLPPEVLELLTIRCFVSPSPWTQPPASLRTGFLRTLSLIAKWDWPREPMIVNTNGEMKQDERDAIQLRFAAWRNIDPGMNRVAFFIASTMDASGVAWTERTIEKVVAARLHSLARATCARIIDAGVELDVNAVFTHNYADYDFLILLNETRIRDLRTKNKSMFKNLQITPDGMDSSLVGYEPVALFVKELESIYRDTLLLFYNPLKPKVIGGLWKPSLVKRPWKVGLGYSTAPLSRLEHGMKDKNADKADAKFNGWAVLTEIRRLGADMIESVELCEHQQVPEQDILF